MCSFNVKAYEKWSNDIMTKPFVILLMQDSTSISKITKKAYRLDSWVALSTKEAGQLFVHAQYRIMAKKWILLKLMWAVDQKPGYNLEWPNLVPRLLFNEWENSLVNCLYCFGSNIISS